MWGSVSSSHCATASLFCAVTFTESRRALTDSWMTYARQGRKGYGLQTWSRQESQDQKYGFGIYDLCPSPPRVFYYSLQ